MVLVKENRLIAESMWQIYREKKGKWLLVGEMSNAQIKQYLLKKKIDWIWISARTYFNQEVQFYLKPQCVIISPKSLYDYVLQRSILNETSYQDEIAMTMEEVNKEERKEVMEFLKGFYWAHSVEEAYQIFENWQCNHSLQNTLANEVVDLFYIYEKEIFNFFK